MTILDFAKNEESLDEFDKTWANYRQIAREGIYKFSDNEIREVYVQLCMILSHAEVKFGLHEAAYKTYKFKLELMEASLLTNKYKVGAHNNRVAQAQDDPNYTDIAYQMMDVEEQKIIWLAQRNAAEHAASSLSRELSFRIK
jgi:hypothetical protein